MTKNNHTRSNKWMFLLYQESAPVDYINRLDELHIPYILSPWHDKDINTETGEIKKSHKHGVLFFDSLKSYNQVSDIVSKELNAPKHVQVVHSTKGTYDYLTHAQNPEKTEYNIEDIEFGAGFNLEEFLHENANKQYLNEVIDMIEDENFTEFSDLIEYARENDYKLLELIVSKTFFFSKYLDSRRFRPKQLKEVSSDSEETNSHSMDNYTNHEDTDKVENDE